MIPTHRNLNNLAKQLRLHGNLLTEPQLQQAIHQHYNDLQGNGLQAARTDTDGSPNAETISQPEAHAMRGPARGAERKANEIRTTLGQLAHNLQRLNDLQREATATPQPVPTKCRVCSTGMIPIGHTRCSNETCNSHGDTTIECANGCGQRLITGTTGKTKPHTIPGVEGKVCRNAYLAHQKLERYDRTKLERGTSTVDVTDTQGMIEGAA